MRNHPLKKFFFIVLMLVIGGAVLAVDQGLASRTFAPVSQASPIHPDITLLDSNGQNVLESGQPVSTMQTCGQCHDADFITSHSFHSDLGLRDFTAPGQVPNGRPWDQSNGLFGKWNPLSYRYLSAPGDELTDLTTLDWVKQNAARLAGGGPLTAMVSTQDAVEMNCFLCHTASPNLDARAQAMQAGNFTWANTATLDGTGLVAQHGDSYVYENEAFTADGKLAATNLQIQDPTNDNCAQCHGVVHTDNNIPLTVNACDLSQTQTATTGQVISSQKISASGVNLADKDALTRSWDVHAERGLKCTDCHYSLNNPVYYQATGQTAPEHLQFDPRRLTLGEYLQKPDHNLARGQSAQYTVAPELKGTMRRCESCHDAASTHQWLPYADRHMQELACESCHIPKLYAPAVQTYDWTAIKTDGSPLVACRGVTGSTTSDADLVTSFTPVLMPRSNIDGGTTLAPQNLVTAFYWVHDSPQGPRPVRLEDLEAAYLENGAYASEVMQAFDDNADGSLSDLELRLDAPQKVELISSRLASLGLQNPHITGEVQPYSINHDVAGGEWATQDCKACHADQSRVSQAMLLSNYTPGGVQPQFVKDTNTLTNGQITTDRGALYYQPGTTAEKLYIFGHSRVSWIDMFGALFFVGVLAAVIGHGTLRLLSTIRSPQPKPEMKKVYMYGVYERFWHWLQTFAIVLLLFTGLIIHRPAIFGVFNFRYVVIVHNVLAALLVLNAALSLFYHLASGEIRQYIPRPYGFFDRAIVQTKYYMQGIFKGKAHPYEKTPEKKLNPLQQATYFGILNVLLPLQIITGALMWGVQRWPNIADFMGGLPVLAPFHTLIAWVFAGFIVGHVYLTTTGPEPLTAIEAMINGWEDVEVEEKHAVAETPQLEPEAGETAASGA